MDNATETKMREALELARKLAELLDEIGMDRAVDAFEIVGTLEEALGEGEGEGEEDDEDDED